jgi:hypothetical protein
METRIDSRMGTGSVKLHSRNIRTRTRTTSKAPPSASLESKPRTSASRTRRNARGTMTIERISTTEVVPPEEEEEVSLLHFRCPNGRDRPFLATLHLHCRD